MEYIRRHLEKKVIELGRAFCAVLITGPRQSGKTTMLKKLAEEEGAGRRYVSLDNLKTRRQAKEDPEDFLKKYAPPVIIDEVQYAPELFTYIKIHIDEYHEKGAFWLTGSQVFSLMRGVEESLAGRIAVLSMAPLSQREIVGAENLPFVPDFDTYLKQDDGVSALSSEDIYKRIWTGSMPNIVSDPEMMPEDYYNEYVATYLQRDIRDLSGNIDVLRFADFMSVAAGRAGQLINYTAMAQDAGITLKQAQDWINVLETMGVVFLLHPFSNNNLKNTVKKPKLYFYDTGLASYLTDWESPEILERSPMAGAFLENYAVSEIRKTYLNEGMRPHMYYYRDTDGEEIDLIIRNGEYLYPVEIKKTGNPDKRITRRFSIIDKSTYKRGTSAVVCTAGELCSYDRANIIMPVRLI